MSLNADDASVVVTRARALQSSARATGWRALLVLEGTADWTFAAARTLVAALAADAPANVCWITDRPLPDATPPGDAASLLGGECGLLIYDAFAALDPDAVGAAVGTLSGGGLMLLLTPPLADWHRFADKQAARIAVYPCTAAEVPGRFVGRLARLLAESPDVVRIRQHAALPVSLPIAAPDASAPAARSRSPAEPATTDQQLAVTEIERTARGRARRPLVLTSDRGRGKSAALGIAAARLIAREGLRVLVTAPRHAAVHALSTHAAAVDAEAARALAYLSPDALAAAAPPADLLLVDEAAGVPAPLLERLLERYPRVVFASTVHGYEGTGRGFEIRFRAVLERKTPGWRQLRLETPVRWRPGDPLERLVDRALLLDAEPASDAAVAAAAAAAPAIRVDLLDRDRLAANEPLLRQVFGLLVLGHYQTRPADLRHLLDGPNLFVLVARAADVVLGTVLGAREGCLPEALLAPIFEGRRRPHGHLLPQTLSAHGGLMDAPALDYARVVRIAVHPAARGRGIGRRLLSALAAAAGDDNADLLGASFGATPELLRFWRRCGLAPVQMGSHRNAASGAHAAVVLQPLSTPGRTLYRRALQRFWPRLAVQLAGPLRALEPDVVVALLPGAPSAEEPLTQDERQEVRAFAEAARGFEAALPPLHRLAKRALPAAIDAGALTGTAAAACITCLLQQRPLPEAAVAVGLSGRAALLSLLRDAVTVLAAVDDPPDQPSDFNR